MVSSKMFEMICGKSMWLYVSGFVDSYSMLFTVEMGRYATLIIYYLSESFKYISLMLGHNSISYIYFNFIVELIISWVNQNNY